MDELEGLECPEGAENIINGKIGNFYIENISNFFSQLRNFFFRTNKILIFVCKTKNNGENGRFALIFRKSSKLNRFLYPHSTL